MEMIFFTAWFNALLTQTHFNVKTAQFLAEGLLYSDMNKTGLGYVILVCVDVAW